MSFQSREVISFYRSGKQNAGRMQGMTRVGQTSIRRCPARARCQWSRLCGVLSECSGCAGVCRNLLGCFRSSLGCFRSSLGCFRSLLGLRWEFPWLVGVYSGVFRSSLGFFSLSLLRAAGVYSEFYPEFPEFLCEFSVFTRPRPAARRTRHRTRHPRRRWPPGTAGTRTPGRSCCSPPP